MPWVGDNSGPNVSQARKAIPHGPKRPKVLNHAPVPELKGVECEGFLKNEDIPSDLSFFDRMLTIDRGSSECGCDGQVLTLVATGICLFFDLRGR